MDGTSIACSGSDAAARAATYARLAGEGERKGAIVVVIIIGGVARA
jgi:hypothetical protein